MREGCGSCLTRAGFNRRAGRNEPLSNLKRYWREIFALRRANAASLGAAGEATLPPEHLEFSVRSVATLRAAGRPLQQLLLAYTQEKHGPSMLVVQSPLRTTALAALAPAVNDFPVVTAPVNSKCGSVPRPAPSFHSRVTHSQFVFSPSPPSGTTRTPCWTGSATRLVAAVGQPPAIPLYWSSPWLTRRVVWVPGRQVRRLLMQFSMVDHWLAGQLDTARYARVPLGNLPTDYPIAVHDLFFARALRQQNHLWWVSSSARPDLGGREDDDNRLLAEMDEDHALQLNEPGVYKTMCVSLDLAGLAVNTVLQSAHINDIEGASSTAVALDALPQPSLDDMVGRGVAVAPTVFDEAAQCTPAFRVLKVRRGRVLQLSPFGLTGAGGVYPRPPLPATC